MALDDRKLHSLARLGLALAAILAVAAASGGLAGTAQAGTACGQYGGKSATELRAGQARAAVRCLVNRKRNRHGVRDVGRNRPLQRAAQSHTEVMRRKLCFSHLCPGEGTLEVRLRVAGYIVSGLSSWAAGENIAWASGRYSSPRSTVNRWMQSPGHRANILSARFRDLGVGFVRGAPQRGVTGAGMYTTDFGRRAR